MSAPIFTVLLPAKGRPALARHALLSVLSQSFGDFEVVVSNNGAEATVRAALADLVNDPRVRYVEQPEVLQMHDHWEALSRLARGRYQTVLTDRSVLRRTALERIAAIHARGDAASDVISWAWDLYHEDVHLLEPARTATKGVVTLESDAIAVASLSQESAYPYSLPRGLNSSVASSVVAELRERLGSAFTLVSPDYTFAYGCLLVRERFVHVDTPLMISQGLSVSNGGSHYVGDAAGPLAEVLPLGYGQPSGLPLAFVESSIADDFYVVMRRLGRGDIELRIPREGIYLRCLRELAEKRAARIVPATELDSISAALEEALTSEPKDVRAAVAAGRAAIDRIGRGRGFKNLLKRLLGRNFSPLRALLILRRGGRRFPDALAAAGLGQMQ